MSSIQYQASCLSYRAWFQQTMRSQSGSLGTGSIQGTSKRNKSPDGSEERCKYFAHHHPKTRHMESYQAKIHKNSVPYFVSRNLFDQKSLRKWWLKEPNQQNLVHFHFSPILERFHIFGLCIWFSVGGRLLHCIVRPEKILKEMSEQANF